MSPPDDIRSAAAARSLPLIVDMDGALLRTDTLFEGFAKGLFAAPLSTLLAIPTLLAGRAQFKRRIAQIAPLDIDSLPLRQDFLDHLKGEHARGRQLHLVSAADQLIVEQVAMRVGLFHSARGSEGGDNLKGAAKAKVLNARFGDYCYAGDSSADLEVWRCSQAMILAGASPGTARKARKLGLPVEAEFLEPGARPRSWRKAMRLHQWSKNLLIFPPLLLSGVFTDGRLWLNCILGFVILGLAASGTYIANDLSDLASDRRHRSKHRRPFASGELKVSQGLIAAPGLIGGALVAAWLLAPAFAAGLLVYVVTTLAYSLRLKRIPFLDVMLLAWLYTLRLLMGVSLAHSASSEWLLAFSMVFFFSMSLAKRYVEVALATDEAKIPGRGYVAGDLPLLLTFGVSSTVASLLILALYLMEEAFPSNVYREPAALWLVLPIIGLWTMRIWLLSHREQLDDDPVSFAVTDRISLALGGALVAVFAYALFA